jgi:hypothetical protein
MGRVDERLILPSAVSMLMPRMFSLSVAILTRAMLSSRA